MNSKGHTKSYDSQDYETNFPKLSNNSSKNVKKNATSQSEEKHQAEKIESKLLPLVGGAKEHKKNEISKDIKRINAENSVTTGGCKNQYNDCFVNALVNGLANTEFRQHILNIDISNRFMPVTKSLQNIFKQMELGVQNINTRHLRLNIPQYTDKVQKDICSFYHDVLLKLIEEETPQNPEVQNESETKPEYQTKYDEEINGSQIKKFFTWLIEKPFTCKNQCGESKNYYAVQCLQLQIPPGDGPFSLEDCIQQSLFNLTDHNNKPKCPTCGIENDQNVNIEVIKIVPQVPIIQLVRSDGRNNVKIQTEIEYNNAVVLNNELIPIAAVLNHHGVTIDSGHYTTYVRGTRTWLHVDDAQVFPVNSVNKSDSYILIYTKQPNHSNEQTNLENSVRVFTETLARDIKVKDIGDTQSENCDNKANGEGKNIHTEKDQKNEVVINFQQDSENYKVIYILGNGHCLFNSIGSSLPKKLSAYEVRHMIYGEALQNIPFYSGLTNSWTGYGDNAEEFEKIMKQNLSSIESDPPIWGNINDLIIACLTLNIDIYSYNSRTNDITAYSVKKGILNKSNFIVLHYDGLQHYEIIKMKKGKRPLVKHFYSFAVDSKKAPKGRMFEYKLVEGTPVLQDLETRRRNANVAGESMESMSDKESNIQSDNKKENTDFNNKDNQNVNGKKKDNGINPKISCSECGKIFKYPSHLTIHLKVHAKEKSKLSCDECGKNFKYPSKLSRHMTMHQDAGKHNCSKCSSSFTQKSTLNRHIEEKHKNAKAHICEICKSSLTNLRNLKRHMEEEHENAESFKCEICKSSLTNLRNLNRHMEEMHENAIVHNCEKCSSKFTNQRNLKAHYECHDAILNIKRREEQTKRKQKSRKNENSMEHFFKSILYGPIFICVCCHQKHFESNVIVFDEDLVAELLNNFPTIFDEALVDDEIWVKEAGKEKGEYLRRMDYIKVDKDLDSNPQNYMCCTCTKHLKKGNVPPMSYKNGLEMYKYEEDEEETLNLSEVGSMLLAKNAIFQKIYLLPKSRWSAVKDRLINVPIPSEVIQETIDSLPSLPTKAGLTAVKFKRKKEFKHGHRQEYINPQQLIEAVKILVKKHPEYKDIKVVDNYVEILSKEDPEAHDILFCSSDNEDVEETPDDVSKTNDDVQEETTSETNDDVQEVTTSEKFENILNLEENEILDNIEEEDDYHKKNDPIKKFQFDYNENIVLTEKHPGAFDNIGASNSESTKEKDNNDENPYIDFAPGEGQTPTNIVSDDKWDINTFPLLFVDGKNGLGQYRKRKLIDGQYFQQRILNYDERFAKNTSYLFGATQYVEQKQLQRNVGLSFTRGKKDQGPDGTSTYSLEDGFSVLDNISNTPKYWSKARQEFISRLENLGAFQFFNTQSCADLRWDENFTSLLRKEANIKIIVDKSTKEDDLDFDEIFVQNMEMSNKENYWNEVENGKVKYIKNVDKNGEEEFLTDEETNLPLLKPQQVPLQYYLDKHMDKSKHEAIRKSVLNATRNFNHKVKAFYRDIIKAKDNKMSIGFYSYRIEFQDRGAGHVHGVLWVDWDAFEENESNIHDFADENEEEIGNGVKKLRTAFKKFKDDEALSIGEYKKIVKFNDIFISCSTNATVVENMLHRIKLRKNIKSDESTDNDSSEHKSEERGENDKSEPKSEERDDDQNNSMAEPPSWTGAEDDDNNEPVKPKQKIFRKTRNSPKEKLKRKEKTQTQESRKDKLKRKLKSKKEKVAQHITEKIVSKVQIHHHTKSCRKYGTICRFSFPKFPTTETILAIPVDKLSKYFEDEEWTTMNDDQGNMKVLKELFSSLKNLDEDERKGVINVYKETLKRVKEVMNEEMKNSENWEKIVNSDENPLDKILQMAETTWEEYRKALSISFSGGYKIIHKRTPKDVMVNNYNPEFLYAWNGNSDIQMTPDYYSVISYIANYVSKDDSSTMEHLKEASKQMGKETLRNKLNIIKNVFLKYRQMGEAEAIYRLLSNLHFKDSNLATKFAPTGFRENRSRFLQRIDEENKYMASGREKISVTGKDGLYVEKPNLVDKYERRPLVDADGQEHPLRHLCYAQFIKEYDPANVKTKTKKQKSENEDDFSSDTENDSDISDDEGNDEKRFIKTFNSDEGDAKMYLPKLIKLTSTYPGEPKYMKRRTHPAALRYHKFRKDNHEYFYSELLLYRPFTKENNPVSEGGLLECKNDLEQCIDEYEKRSNEADNSMTDSDDDSENEQTEKSQTDLEIVKLKVMPHLENVEEGRLRAQESKQINSEVGENIDPENEQENDDLEDEELIEDPDHLGLLPGELDSPSKIGGQSIGKDAKQSGQSYRRIELIKDEEMYAKMQSLDPEQRMVVDITIKFSKNIVKAFAATSQKPKPPRLIVQGGAGSGKSTVINLMSQWAERILRKAGDDPNMPYVIKAAFTGAAANVIDGQTLHSAFSFTVNRGTEYFPLGDKIVDEKRVALKNLKMVIIDEMSLLSADLLYQLNLRLQEITLKKELFGGCGIFFFGDLLQLPAVKAASVFAKPWNKEFQTDYDMGPIWWEFDSINLVTNHRQGSDKHYADILNRMRIGELTDEDLKTLQTRVFSENHPDLPKNALNIRCTNKEVKKINEEKLKENPNPEIAIKAINIQTTKKNFKPKILDGKVGTTALMDILKLKIDSEVLVTNNIDVCDALVNGSRGKILDFIRFPNGEIQYIIVEFHDEKAGRERRKQFPNIQLKYPNHRPVPIERIDVSYSLAKQQKSGVASAKVFQFPLTLGDSCTGHRAQGITVSKPNTIVTDLRRSFIPSLCYVICSRTQSMEQLFILEGLPKGKTGFNCVPVALDEVNILDETSLNKNPSTWYKERSNLLKISCLNVRSLGKHFEDIKKDFALLKSNIIILTETWIHLDTNGERFKLDNYYTPILNSAGRGKGLCIYFKNEQFTFGCNINGDDFQVTKIESEKLDIFGVYRSQTGDKNLLVSKIAKEVSKEKDTIIFGDFNINYLQEKSNTVSVGLETLGFKQLVQVPTHDCGGLIDHVYYRAFNPLREKHIELFIHSVYYSDHDGILFTMSDRDDNIDDSQQVESLVEQRMRKRKLFKDTCSAATTASSAYLSAQKAVSDIKESESATEAREAFSRVETAANNAVISSEFATNAANQVQCARGYANVANEAAEKATNLFSSAHDIRDNFLIKSTASKARKRKSSKESLINEVIKKGKLSQNKKRKAGSESEENCDPKVPKQTNIGCPVCQDGQEFDGGGHQCTKCKRFVHPFCATAEKVEGFGSKVICNDCKKN